jgi:hypothetical protein
MLSAVGTLKVARHEPSQWSSDQGIDGGHGGLQGCVLAAAEGTPKPCSADVTGERLQFIQKRRRLSTYRRRCASSFGGPDVRTESWNCPLASAALCRNSKTTHSRCRLLIFRWRRRIRISAGSREGILLMTGLVFRLHRRLLCVLLIP